MRFINFAGLIIIMAAVSGCAAQNCDGCNATALFPKSEINTPPPSTPSEPAVPLSAPMPSQSKPSHPQIKPSPKTITALIKSIYPQPSWHYLRTDRAGPDEMGYTVELTIVYKQDVDEFQVRGDTDFVARKVLNWITKTQKLGGDKIIIVSVCGIQDGFKGITGKPLVVPLGCTDYNNMRDELEFDENENAAPSWLR